MCVQWLPFYEEVKIGHATPQGLSSLRLLFNIQQSSI